MTHVRPSAIIHIVDRAGAERPLVTRVQDALTPTPEVEEHIQHHQSAILMIAERRLHRALKGFSQKTERYRSMIEAHLQNAGAVGSIPYLKFYSRGFDAIVNYLTRWCLWGPTTLWQYEIRWSRMMVDEIERRISIIASLHLDRARYVPQLLYDLALPMVAAIDHAPSAGLQKIFSHPGNNPMTTGPNWIAWIYAWDAVPGPCATMGMPRNVPHSLHDNPVTLSMPTNIPYVVPIAPFSVVQMPALQLPTRQMPTRQTQTDPHRSHSI